MKILFRTLLVLLGIVLLWWAVEMIAAETGEVVVVTITAADGSTDKTRLWVVDHDGSAWLRAGNQDGRCNARYVRQSVSASVRRCLLM